MSPARLGLMLVLILLASGRGAVAAGSCGSSCSCTVTGTSVALPGYDPTASVPVAAAGTVNVSCQLQVTLGAVSVPYQINLSKGQAPSYLPRKLSGPGGALLSYNLYSDAGLTTVWGDGTGGSQAVTQAVTVSVVGLNVSLPTTVYANVPGGQNVPAGAYSDSVVMTLQF